MNINVALWIVIAIIIGYTSGLLVYFSKKITFKNILPVLLLTPCFVLLMIPSVFLFVIQKKDDTFKKKLLFLCLALWTYPRMVPCLSRQFAGIIIKDSTTETKKVKPQKALYNFKKIIFPEWRKVVNNNLQEQFAATVV